MGFLNSPDLDPDIDFQKAELPLSDSGKVRSKHFEQVLNKNHTRFFVDQLSKINISTSPRNL